MASEVKLPRLGQGMESGTIVKWLKREGDEVAKGEPLYEVDTEKVTQEVEADLGGVLLRIAVEEGEVPVGQTIAWIGEAGEPVADDGAPEPVESEEPLADARAPEPVEEAPTPSPPSEGEQSSEVEPPAAAATSTAQAAEGRLKASPLARRIARERGIDLAGLVGTGPDGRIVAEDVERAASAPGPAAPSRAAAAPAEAETRPLTGVRRTIARRLTEAWTIPVFQLVVSADMERVNTLVARRRELGEDVQVNVTDVLIKASATALMRHRDVNVQFTEEALLVQPRANIGLAVAAPSGLVVPVIPAADGLSLAEIAVARADVVGRARESRLKPDDLQGGTFTISNLGMFGIEQFSAILNPPQAAILAVGAIEERPVARGGEIVARPMMAMTLTCDHRAVDGAPAAAFLETVKALLEEPGLAL
jgi:pyruvate dehydrogenase E2 component (dihydrolipoamide acetyltransferase)